MIAACVEMGLRALEGRNGFLVAYLENVAKKLELESESIGIWLKSRKETVDEFDFEQLELSWNLDKTWKSNTNEHRILDTALAHSLI